MSPKVGACTCTHIFTDILRHHTCMFTTLPKFIHTQTYSYKNTHSLFKPDLYPHILQVPQLICLLSLEHRCFRLPCVSPDPWGKEYRSFADSVHRIRDNLHLEHGACCPVRDEHHSQWEGSQPWGGGKGAGEDSARGQRPVSGLTVFMYCTSTRINYHQVD